MKKIFPFLLLFFGSVLLFSQTRTGGGGSGGIGQTVNCGTTVACAGTSQSGVKVIYGTAPLTSGTPSTATLTGLPFTSSSTFVCSGTDQTTATNNLIKFANASGSSTVITGPATVSDVIGYVCVGT